MTGLDKIISEIGSDSSQRIKEISDEANKKAEEISLAAEKKASEMKLRAKRGLPQRLPPFWLQPKAPPS